MNLLDSRIYVSRHIERSLRHYATLHPEFPSPDHCAEALLRAALDADPRVAELSRAYSDAAKAVRAKYQPGTE